LEPGTRASCYIEYLTKSSAWQAEQQARRQAANGARSEAAKLRPRNNDGTLAPSSPVSPDTAPDNRARVQHAEAAGASQATLGRAFALHTARPDIHARVVAGEFTLREGLRLKRRDEVHKKLAALRSDKFRVVYADPPWSYAHPREGCGAAEDHYPSMSLQQICAIDVASICWPDAALFLWTTSLLLPQGLGVMNAWGFEYKACFVWDKVTQNFGFYNSVRHEFLLIGTRGSCFPEVPDLIDSVQSIERSKQHSEKPAAFRALSIGFIHPGRGSKCSCGVIFRRVGSAGAQRSTRRVQ
jgi:N6-adenosine-specific RNA methylase IME4